MKTNTAQKMASSLANAWLAGYPHLVRDTIRKAINPTSWRRATYNLLPKDQQEPFLKFVMEAI